MFGKEITFTNYKGEAVTKKYYFSLDDIDVLNTSFDGGVDGMLGLINKIQDTKDARRSLALTQDLILKSYGEFADSEHFYHVKDGRALSEDFRACPAFVVLYKELMDADKLMDFIKKVMSPELRAKIEEEAAKGTDTILPSSPMIVEK